MPHFHHSPFFINLTALDQSPGDLTLSDGYWGTEESIILHVNVKTNSTNWDLWLLPDSNFNLSDPRTEKLVEGAIGDIDIDNNDLYSPGDTNVYLRYTDNSGSNTASFYITGNTI